MSGSYRVGAGLYSLSTIRLIRLFLAAGLHIQRQGQFSTVFVAR